MNEGPNGSDGRLMESVRAAITLPRLQIVEETERAYKVLFGDSEYEISKGSETHFFMNVSASFGQGMRLVMVPRQGGNYIEQDENVPTEFKEAMMVHEIREMEYRSAGMDAPHERAVHDETLYALKHLPEPVLAIYFEFARKYRLAALQAGNGNLDAR